MYSESSMHIRRAWQISQHLDLPDEFNVYSALGVQPCVTSSSADGVQSFAAPDLASLNSVLLYSAPFSMDSILLSEYTNGLRMITLNRASTLNSLTIDMFQKLRFILRDYEQNPTALAVVVVGAGDKAFCAGGDLKQFVATGEKFVRLEYPLDQQIFRMSKPYIALWDGYVMGGGSGVSSFGSHRVCTERVQWAMPEVTVGLFPDVGSSYLFSRMPGKVGLYLAMTGERLNAADCLFVGLATHFVPQKNLRSLLSSLSSLETDLTNGKRSVDDVISRHAAPCSLESPMRRLQPQIDRLFSGETVEKIFEALRNDGSEFAIATLKLLRKKGPFSLKVVKEQLYRAEGKSIEDVLRMEFRLAIRIHARADLKEGVRARLVDKDNNPKFSPASVEEVSDSEVQMCFWPFADPKFELQFD